MKRRALLNRWVGAWGILGMAGLDFLSYLPSVSAAETKLASSRVRFGPLIEPLARFVEDAPREWLLECYGVRDFRELGHEEIHLANSFLALQVIGWQHAPPHHSG